MDSVRNRKSSKKTRTTVANNNKNLKNGHNIDSLPPSSIYLPENHLKIQLILIGDRNVGKTCLLERFTDDIFHDNLTSTVGIDFKLKTVQIDNRIIRLQIWDTAGQERFNSITTAYYRGARGVLVVYDVTRKETYTDITRWMALLEKYGRSDVVIGIVGNKADLNRHQVDMVKAKKAAEDNGFMFFETSAKENTNIESAFVCLISEIMKRMPERLHPSFTQASLNSDDTNRTNKKFGCC